MKNKPGWKKPFFIIWSGQVFSLLGSGLVQYFNPPVAEPSPALNS